MEAPESKECFSFAARSVASGYSVTVPCTLQATQAFVTSKHYHDGTHSCSVPTARIGCKMKVSCSSGSVHCNHTDLHVPCSGQLIPSRSCCALQPNKLACSWQTFFTRRAAAPQAHQAKSQPHHRMLDQYRRGGCKDLKVQVSVCATIGCRCIAPHICLLAPKQSFPSSMLSASALPAAFSGCISFALCCQRASTQHCLCSYCRRRPPCPVVVVSTSELVLRQCSVSFGLIPLKVRTCCLTCFLCLL
jgi:hypothetical protein